MLKVASVRLSINNLKKLAIGISLISAVYFFYLRHLGSLTSGLSPAEAAARKLSSNWHFITNNPINAPLRVLQNLLQYLGHTGAFYMRLPSVIFMILFIWCLYVILRTWFGRLVGILGCLLLIGTPWIILQARSVTAGILLLLPLCIVSSFLWLNKTTRYQKLAMVLLAISVAACLYVPGLIWFLVITGLLNYKVLLSKLRQSDTLTISICTVLILVILSPVAAATYNNISIGKQLLLIPDNWQGAVASLKSVAWSALSLIWRTPYHTDLTLGRLPFLNISQIALATFGVYAMFSRARRQAYQLFAGLSISILLSGLNNKLDLLLPAVLVVCIFATAGLRYLYVEWRGIFPKNPIPKYLAVSLMILVVGMHLSLGVHYALRAWPDSSATHLLYVIK